MCSWLIWLTERASWKKRWMRSSRWYCSGRSTLMAAWRPSSECLPRKTWPIAPSPSSDCSSHGPRVRNAMPPGRALFAGTTCPPETRVRLASPSACSNSATLRKRPDTSIPRLLVSTAPRWSALLGSCAHLALRRVAGEELVQQRAQRRHVGRDGGLLAAGEGRQEREAEARQPGVEPLGTGHQGHPLGARPRRAAPPPRARRPAPGPGPW